MDDSILSSLFPFGKRKNILIAAAVYEEIEPLLGFYGDFEKSVVGRKYLYIPDIHDQSIRILVTGPGMINASQGLTAAIESEKPDLIIQTGCAGVFRNRGIGIGDVAVATKERDIHLGVESGDRFEPPAALPFNIPGTVKNGDVEICAALSEFCFKSIFDSEKDFNLSKGPFITVSTVTSTEERASLLDKWYSPVMESMEGAATAQVSGIYGIPYAEVRSASNFVGKRDKSSWNLPLAFRNASAAITMILKRF
ncbi:futalosine hydrolase [Desulforegula conservatrix]|uniref:futalosine hydrolase n=1 Tax=Desulforegula conservatrix TaxID=153026 RepID=UPI0003F50DAB|nr:futalosine hydrolase [Desulforegula conservatrix]